MPTSTLLNNRYRIIKTIGEGRFDHTFIAEDTQHSNKQRCVVKQLKSTIYNAKEQPTVENQLTQSVAALKSVGNGQAQLPKLQDSFTDQGLFYLVYEWIDGTPLSASNSLPWPEEKVTTLVASLLGTLSHLHNSNLIHQDLNPDNIIISHRNQRPYLIDFGAVELLLNQADLNASKAGAAIMVKTRGFMSPEQATGRALPSSNLYSLGMVAIYLLTGKSPLRIPTDKHNGRLLWRQLAPNVSDRTAGILTRAIHTNPAIRFSSADEMRSVLTQTQLAQPAAAQPPVARANPLAASAPTRIAQENSAQAARPSQQIAERSVKKSLEATEVSLGSSSPSSPKRAATAVAVPSPPHQLQSLPSQQPKKSFGAKIDDFFRQIPLKWVGLSVGGAAIAVGIFSLGNRVFFSERETVDASSLAQIEENIATLEDKLENQPNSASLNLQLAENYVYAGNIEAANAIIDSVLAEDEENVDALALKGQALIYQSDYSQAIDVLTEATEKNERHAKSAILLGQAYQEIGQYDSAEEQFEAATSLRGNKGEAYLKLSYLQNLRGDIRGAINSAERALKAAKGDQQLRTHAQLGTLHFDLKDIDQAEEEWGEAITLSPKNPEDYVVQSISKFFLSDSEGALNNLEQAVAINPNFGEAYAMQSLIHLNKGEIDPAVAAIEKALAIDESSVSTLKIIADVALSLPEPDPEFAFSAINQALQINDSNPYVLNQRCNVLMSARQLDDAIFDCSRSIEINPNNIEAYNTRGQAYIAQSDFANAEADFTRIIEINDAVGRPQDAAAYAQRAVARTGLQDAEGAKADLETALELNSQL